MLTILFSVAALLIFIFCLLSFIFKLQRALIKKEIDKKYKPDNIILCNLSANFLGIKSIGAKQLRGNGALVLTKKELYFLRAVPRKEFVIPLENITIVEMSTFYMGKSIFRPLLCVNFNDGEKEDTIGWAVTNPEKWKESIEKA